jgi:hypothetical protein
MAPSERIPVALTKDEWRYLYDAIGCTVEYALDTATFRPDRKHELLAWVASLGDISTKIGHDGSAAAMCGVLPTAE